MEIFIFGKYKLFFTRIENILSFCLCVRGKILKLWETRVARKKKVEKYRIKLQTLKSYHRTKLYENGKFSFG